METTLHATTNYAEVITFSTTSTNNTSPIGQNQSRTGTRMTDKRNRFATEKRSTPGFAAVRKLEFCNKCFRKFHLGITPASITTRTKEQYWNNPPADSSIAAELATPDRGANTLMAPQLATIRRFWDFTRN
jgi:hypothetical protein